MTPMLTSVSSDGHRRYVTLWECQINFFYSFGILEIKLLIVYFIILYYRKIGSWSDYSYKISKTGVHKYSCTKHAWF